MNLTIESTSRCQYCHPETCNCPDYVLKLGDADIASGNRDKLDTIKKALEQWRADTTDAEPASDLDDKYITDVGSECYDFYKDGEQFSVFIKKDGKVGLVANVSGKSYLFSTERIPEAERDCKDCEGLLEDITELNKELNPEAYGIVDAERAALLSRIEESCSKPCEMHSDHERALYLLADIREYLSGVKL